MFESLFFSVFRYYRLKGSKRSIFNAVVYLTLLQVGLLLNGFIFVSVLTKNLPSDLFSNTNNYFLGAGIIIVLYFINALQYSGRNLSVKRAKQKIAAYTNMSLLWTIPILLIILAMILYHAA